MDAVNRNDERFSAAKKRPGRVTYTLGWLAEIWERLWPLLVPAFLFVCAFLAATWFGVWQAVPEVVRYGLAAVSAVVLVVAILPLGRFRLPARHDVLRRIERASHLQHSPVTLQSEKAANLREATSDGFSGALWREHKRRMAAQLDDLSAGTPKPDANRLDRWALRAMLPLVAFVAWGYSHSVGGGRIADIVQPAVDHAAVLSRLDAWANPPAYTGKPPVYLSGSEIGTGDEPEGKFATLPAGSELILRYVGEEEVSAGFRVGETVTAIEPAPRTGDGNVGENGAREMNFSAILKHSGTVEFLARGQLLAGWPIKILPDRAPTIRFEEKPGGSLTGSLELAYSVEDDHGVVSARAIVRSTETEEGQARPLYDAPEINLPLPRSRAKNGTARVNRDLSSHPWAGSQVEITLEATDDPGQIGRSMPIVTELPGRNFRNQMARALVEQRRILALDANRSRYVADLIDAVTTHPEEFNIVPSVFVPLRSAYRMIAQAASNDKLREAADILWETALALELGNLSEVERRLREAQERLSQALEEGASDEEIDRLMDELRQAMNDFLEQMAREMAENPIEQNPLNNFGDMQTLTQRDIERMMDQIENLAKSGSQDAARQLLSELQRMMDNLQAGRHQNQRQAEGNQLNQSLDKLSELMRQQQQLMDETYSMRQRAPGAQQNQQNQQGQQNRQNQRGQRNDQPQNGESMTPEEFAEAMKRLQERQQALRQQLGELGQQLEDLGLDPSSEFGEAGDEMAQAERNLEGGSPGEAAGDQGEALEALRRGARSMMQQLAGDRNQGGRQVGQNGPNGQDRRSDPLGRSTEANGRFNDEATKVPSEIDAQRAREILEAIRNRLSDPLRPLIERNYLERLLQRR